MRILLLKATHFPFVAAIWAYENAPWKSWWGPNEDSTDKVERGGSWHLSLDPQSYSRATSQQVQPHNRTQTTPRKGALDRVRQSNYCFDPSPGPKPSNLAALMSRSEVSLIRHPRTRDNKLDNKLGPTLDTQNPSDNRPDASVAADLEELKRMVNGLGGLLEELTLRLDHRLSDLSGSEEDEE